MTGAMLSGTRKNARRRVCLLCFCFFWSFRQFDKGYYSVNQGYLFTYRSGSARPRYRYPRLRPVRYAHHKYLGYRCTLPNRHTLEIASCRVWSSRKCLTVDTASGGAAGAGRGLSLEEEKAFKDAFPAVMVDTALGFNIFGRSFIFIASDCQ